MGILLLLFVSVVIGTFVSPDQRVEDIDIEMCMRKPPPERLPPYMAPAPFPSPPPSNHRSRSSSIHNYPSTIIFLIAILIAMRI